jgi:hypothetical protein
LTGSYFSFHIDFHPCCQSTLATFHLFLCSKDKAHT